MKFLWFSFCLVAMVWAEAEVVEDDGLDCDGLQRCLDREDRKCWRSFCENLTKKPVNNLQGFVASVIFTKAGDICDDFLDEVDRVEKAYLKEYMKSDRALEKCMGEEKGWRQYQHYCGDQRPIGFVERFNNLKAEENRRKKREAGEEASEENADQCWFEGLKYCMSLTPVKEEVRLDMEECDLVYNVTEREQAVGAQVGATVIKQFLQKQPIKQHADEMKELIHAVATGKSSLIEDIKKSGLSESDKSETLALIETLAPLLIKAGVPVAE